MQDGLVRVLPLYSALPRDRQQQVFQPVPADNPRDRKIIVATNMAESIVAIESVLFVIDPGFAKQKVYNPRIRVESPVVSPIWKVSMSCHFRHFEVCHHR